MPNAIYNLWKVLCDFLLPRCCPGCGQELLPYEIPCCLACQAALPFTHFETFANNPVFQRMEELVPTVHATALFYLHDGGIIQQLIHQLKFNGQQHLGPWLGNLLAKQLKNSPYAHCTAIVPLPLHPKKKEKEGTIKIINCVSSLPKSYRFRFTPMLFFERKIPPNCL